VIAHDCLSGQAVVVGGGVAGLSTALALGDCIVVADEPVGGGSSALAQGGIAAALNRDDSPALHATDTLRVAAGLADPAIATIVAHAAPDRIGWLRSLGVAFDLSASGALALGREAGHGRHRIVHAGGDRTGAEVMRILRAVAKQRADIRLLEGFTLVDLVTAGNRAAGVWLEAADRARIVVLSPHVVLATGGIGACFDRTTNPATSRGAGLAAAARRGVALADVEFVQFHPTALDVALDPAPLLTEALRGAGAVLLDDSGERFMKARHPDAELAPRDIMARSVAALRAVGRSVFLDATGVAALATRFPGACAIARAAGFDPERQPLPVTPAAHFHMGGIATDGSGATSLPGLWACGEVAATGLHGGNRLASNSLLEGLVFGERIARAIRASNLPPAQGLLDVPRRYAEGPADTVRLTRLRRIVGEALGPVRSGVAMSGAFAELDAWLPAARAEEDLLTVARLLLRAALARRESRGAHHRLDYPALQTGSPARSQITPEPSPVISLTLARKRVA
jgi:L-aspartate oxidase